MALEKSKSIEAGLQIMVSDETKDVKLMTQLSSQKTFCQKLKVIFTNITVEPIMMCYILPSVMSVIATQNLNLEKACRVNLQLDIDTCDALTAKNESFVGYKIAERQVQQLVTNRAMYKNVLQSLFPTVLLLFLGSWSDRQKRRKPCIIIPIIGEICMCLGLLISTYFFFELPIEFNVLVESLPAITGGWVCMFMGVFSYISTITSKETRTLRIGAVNMFSNVSIGIGIALSGVSFKFTGFYGVYVLGLIMYIIGLIYGIFFVNDITKTEQDVKEEGSNRKYKNSLLDFFDVRYVKETFKVVFKKGERNRRLRICLIMILAMFIIGPIHGEMNVVYLFGRYKFGWDSIGYSIFSTVQFVTHIFGTLFSLMVFTKFLQVDDAILGIISSTSKILASIVYAFAPTIEYLYLGAFVEILNGTSFIALRSLISKLVPPNELGKVNSLFGVCEAIIPLVYGPLYSFLYSKTMNSLPGAFFLAGGILTIPAVLIFFWLYVENTKDKKEIKLAESSKLMKDYTKSDEENK